MESIFRNDLWEKLIKTRGGITVSLFIYQQILIHIHKRPTQADLELYLLAMEETLGHIAQSEQDIREIRTNYLTANYPLRRKFRDIILVGMRERIGDATFGESFVKSYDPSPEFGKFERQFAAFVCEKLQIIDLYSLKQKAPEGVSKKCEVTYSKLLKQDPNAKIHEILDLGQLQQIIRWDNNAGSIMPLLRTPDFVSDASVEGALDAIRTAKNDLSHGRRINATPFAKVCLAEFNRLLAL